MARQKQIVRKTSGDNKSAPRKELVQKAARMTPLKEDAPLKKAKKVKKGAKKAAKQTNED